MGEKIVKRDVMKKSSVNIKKLDSVAGGTDIVKIVANALRKRVVKELGKDQFGRGLLSGGKAIGRGLKRLKK